MNRLQLLVERGYPKETVLSLTSFNEEDIKSSSIEIFNNITHNCIPVINPKALFVGGQPGSGKSTFSLNTKRNIQNVVVINLDDYRFFHPNYKEIEKNIIEKWENQTETINNSCGNDMADMTQSFVGVLADKLTEMACEQHFNMILEWGMREPHGPLKTIKYLKDNHYTIEIIFIAQVKELSFEACQKRHANSDESTQITRTITKDFHDTYVESIPQSANVIFDEGFKNFLIDKFTIIKSDGSILWNNNMIGNPGTILKQYLNLR